MGDLPATHAGDLGRGGSPETVVEFAKVEREDSLSAFRTSLRERNKAYLRERHATRLAQLMRIDEKYTWGPSEKLKGIRERARFLEKMGSRRVTNPTRN